MSEQGYIEGIFIREKKNRFLCIVRIAGKDMECYIPSSCRLGNFINLKGKSVLLRKNLAKNTRTAYAVYAVRHKRNYLLLRPSEANDIVYKEIKRRIFCFLGKRTLIERERFIDGYKTDIYLPESRTILEIKSIITVNQEAIFPTVHSERSIRQLKQLQILLQKGYKVTYIFVSLNPYVKAIRISSAIEQQDFVDMLRRCITLGMLCKGYCVHLIGGNTKIKKAIKINV